MDVHATTKAIGSDVNALWQTAKEILDVYQIRCEVCFNDGAVTLSNGVVHMTTLSGVAECEISKAISTIRKRSPSAEPLSPVQHICNADAATFVIY